jgi:hypothetical protein
MLADFRLVPAKQLLECTTLSVSCHRATAPVRACGFTNPKDFVLGTRTIAGSIVATQFTVDLLMRFLQAIYMVDVSKDAHYYKTDQLPPFNLTLLFSNELGFASYQRLLGVRLVTDGVVYSHQDLMTERTFSWVAMDFTPLLPLNFSSLFETVNPTDPRSSHQTGWNDLVTQYNSTPALRTPLVGV